MENIEKFKRLYYFNGDGKKLSNEEVEKLGLNPEYYESLEETAYQTAYDLTEDWSKEPDTAMLQEAYKKGVDDGMQYVLNRLVPEIDELLKLVKKL